MARGNLLEGNLYRTILRLSLPIMVNNFIQTLYNLVDSLWLGRVGSDELAAVSFVRSTRCSSRWEWGFPSRASR